MALSGWSADERLLSDLVHAALRRGADDWTVKHSEFWCAVEPSDGRARKQGWKLHVSATPLSAPIVLARAVEILIRHRAAFKFARSIDRVQELVSPRCDRGSGGKFITVYPATDEHFLQLAKELHGVTQGLAGPGILSDRRYLPGSLVYYRYGAFIGHSVLTNDGGFALMVKAPDGTMAKDRRQAWFSPPPWTTSPLGLGPAEPVAPQALTPPAVMLNDRFVVRKAIRHAYRGGVYRATEEGTGREVVIKEARPGVGASLDGTDVRDALRHEAEMLDRLEPLGIAPRSIAVFEQGDNVFLAQELIPGTTLRDWVVSQDSAAREDLVGSPPAPLLDVVRQLVALVAAVHGLGFVLRDLNPNNVMVTPEGRLRLIDLELATRPGERVARAYTPSYAGPEVVEAATMCPAPECSADLYSLGATVFFLIAGVDPILVSEHPVSRPASERLAALLRLRAVYDSTSRRMAPLVAGLMADAPERRWTLRQAEAFVRALSTPPALGARPAEVSELYDVADHGRLSTADQERLLVDGLAHVIDTMNQDDSVRLWPAGAFGDTNDPLNVQHGAGGVLAVLTRVAAARDDGPARAAMAEVAAWVDERLDQGPRVLPGLYFGRSGTAWALYDAARQLGDTLMADRSADFARRVPVRWPNPDICHGAAGAGMAQLHFLAATGDPVFGERARACAEGVAAAAKHHPVGVVWPIPRSFDSELAGVTHFGFAHGVAGIGTFLLLAGLALERPDFVDVARAAGKTLVRAAIVAGPAAWWPSGEEHAASPDERLVHWCSGSSGVGTFLIRLWQATGDERLRELAEQGAVAVRRARWSASPAACHGLSGNAEFLLDLAAALGEPRYREWAEELAACIHVRHGIRNGRMVLPDESHADVTVGYNTGLSGVLGFLLRLRHGGTRLWVPDAMALAPASGPAQPPQQEPRYADARS